jgi:UDP-N-acetylglucosamine 2-epimerase (non-hydrolysing)
MLIAGARPNFMKIAPIWHALTQRRHEVSIVHTGQHYDSGMSDTFFNDLGLPEPDYNLGVGSASHAVQTARVLERFEPVLLEVAPDWVVVVGDVNSTLACALVASKHRAQLGCRIAHVEAGLRSRDWSMPEEVNRVLTDRLADLLLTPSRDADENLLAEGVPPDRIVFAGNVMIDSLFAALPRARALEMPARFGTHAGDYAVFTLHRPSNVDHPLQLRTIIEGLARTAAELKVIFPAHPRTRQRLEEFDPGLLSRIQMVPPLGYLEMLGLVQGAALVVTDSGGLQEETTALGVPCVTLRESTERPVTITHGTNKLAPWPLTASSIASTCSAARREHGTAHYRCTVEGWDGQAALRVAGALEQFRAGLIQPAAEPARIRTPA